MLKTAELSEETQQSLHTMEKYFDSIERLFKTVDSLPQQVALLTARVASTEDKLGAR
jgi:uncharacterized protein YoxC